MDDQAASWAHQRAQEQPAWAENWAAAEPEHWARGSSAAAAAAGKIENWDVGEWELADAERKSAVAEWELAVVEWESAVAELAAAAAAAE